MSEHTRTLEHRDNGTRHWYTSSGTHRHWDTQTEGHTEPGTHMPLGHRKLGHRDCSIPKLKLRDTATCWHWDTQTLRATDRRT